MEDNELAMEDNEEPVDDNQSSEGCAGGARNYVGGTIITDDYLRPTMRDCMCVHCRYVSG